jgi:hypothetical protein
LTCPMVAPPNCSLLTLPSEAGSDTTILTLVDVRGIFRCGCVQMQARASHTYECALLVRGGPRPADLYPVCR